MLTLIRINEGGDDMNRKILLVILQCCMIVLVSIAIIQHRDHFVTQATIAHIDQKLQMYEQNPELELPEGYVRLKCGKVILGEEAPQEIQQLDELPEGYYRTSCGSVLKVQAN